MATLTHHKKSVRAMALHPKECVAEDLTPYFLHDKRISFTLFE